MGVIDAQVKGEATVCLRRCDCGGHAEGRDGRQVLKPKWKSQRGKGFPGRTVWNAWGCPRAGVLCEVCWILQTDAAGGSALQRVQMPSFPKRAQCASREGAASFLPNPWLWRQPG